MSFTKQLAIYMDNSNAILTELENPLIVSRTITDDSKEGTEKLNLDDINHTEEGNQIRLSYYHY